MNVLVTGSASGFAQILLARLAADPGIELILGVDQRESAFTHERYVQVVLDLRSPLLARVLQDMQAVIHLAPAAGDRAAASGELLQAAQNLYTRAQAADTQHLIHLSSALIYSARADVRIDEQHERGAVTGCAAAAALQATEDWLDDFEREHPLRRLVRLRPHWLVGPHTDSVLARLLRQRLTFRQSRTTHLQCVHEDDVVDAIMLALHSKVRGAFNLACQDDSTLAAMHRQTRWLRLPAGAWLLAQRLDTEPGCIDALSRSLLLDTTHARSKLDWRPRYDKARDILRHA